MECVCVFFVVVPCSTWDLCSMCLCVCVCVCVCVCAQTLSCVLLFAIPWTVVHQSPPSMEFSRQEYWSGLPFPTPGDPPDPGIEPASLISPALAGGSFTAPPLGKPPLFPDRGSNPSSLHWKHRGLNHWTARRVLWIVFRKHIYMSLRLTSQEYFQMLF